MIAGFCETHRLKYFITGAFSSGFLLYGIVPEQSAFTESRLERARPLEVASGVTAMVSSPEDVILNKLLFYRLGRSQKHLNDISNILKVRDASLDRKYLDEWALRLGVVDEWQAVLQPPLFPQ